MSSLSATSFVKVWNTFGTFRFLKVNFSQIFWITGNAAALHASTDKFVAVLGAVFDLGLFSSTAVGDATNLPGSHNERGYLLAHPNLLEP